MTQLGFLESIPPGQCTRVNEEHYVQALDARAHPPLPNLTETQKRNLLSCLHLNVPQSERQAYFDLIEKIMIFSARTTLI
jgi:hypothetical protein